MALSAVQDLDCELALKFASYFSQALLIQGLLNFVGIASPMEGALQQSERL